MYEDCKSRFVCYNHVDPILFIRSFFMILILTFIVIFIFEFEFLYSCCTILNIIDEMIPCSSFMYGIKKGDKECICISYTQATYTSKTFHNCAEIWYQKQDDLEAHSYLHLKTRQANRMCHCCYCCYEWCSEKMLKFSSLLFLKLNVDHEERCIFHDKGNLLKW